MRKPFLTPPSMPEELECRSLLIPSSKEWLGIFNSALLELTQAYNYEQVNGTDLTPEEVAAYCYEQYVAWLSSVCGDCPPGEGCELEGGQRLLRLGIGGHVEEWRDGEWLPPDGEYLQPPIPPRTEPTDEEKRCLAAANAVNVYGQLYEITTDAATDFEFLDEFLDAVFDGIGIWVGLWAGETAKAFSQVARQFASEFFLFWEEITEDYWDEEFEAEFLCILYNNATVQPDNSVTFDYDAFRTDISNWALGTLNINYLLLVAQLEYLFYFTGAADGFNAAGGTTAVDEADCSGCEDTTWCYYFDFALTDGSFEPTDTPPLFGTWVSGLGWNYQDKVVTITNPDQARRQVQIHRSWSPATTLTRVEVIYDYTQGSFPSARNALTVQTNIGALININNNVLPAGTDINANWSGTQSGVTTIDVFMRSCVDQVAPYVYNGNCCIRGLRLEGTGDNPFGADNCPE